MNDGISTRLVDLIPRDGTVLLEGGAGASRLLADGLVATGNALGNVAITGIQVPGVNRQSWLPAGPARFDTFFMTPELAACGSRVRLLPYGYAQIGRHLRGLDISAALFSVSPPDDDGVCSFGPTVDFLPDLWPGIPVRIGHVNPSLPRTSGTPGIPIGAFHALADQALPIICLNDADRDTRTLAIARTVATYVRDGVTIQTGLGKLPGAILGMLRDHRRLAIHSGLIGDGVLDLLDSGAIAAGSSITTGVAIGSQRLYNALPDTGIRFRPVSHTHDPTVIAAIPGFISINGALEIDLFGQAYSERGPGGWMSGVGGVNEFARAAAQNGLRIIALPATGGGASRIVAAGAGQGPVTLSRFDTDIVVTEFGAADLRGLTHEARAAALIDIAHPDHRETLARGWRDGMAHEKRIEP